MMQPSAIIHSAAVSNEEWTARNVPRCARRFSGSWTPGARFMAYPPNSNTASTARAAKPTRSQVNPPSSWRPRPMLVAPSAIAISAVSPISTRSTDVSTRQAPIVNAPSAAAMWRGCSSHSVRPRSVHVPRSSISTNSVFDPT